MGNLLSTPSQEGNASAAHHPLTAVQMDRRKSFNNLLRAVDPRLLRNRKGSSSDDRNDDASDDNAPGGDVALLLSNYGIAAMAAMSAAGFFMPSEYVKNTAVARQRLTTRPTMRKECAVGGGQKQNERPPLHPQDTTRFS